MEQIKHADRGDKVKVDGIITGFKITLAGAETWVRVKIGSHEIWVREEDVHND